MAQVLNLSPLHSSSRPDSTGARLQSTTQKQNGKQSWASLQQELKCNGKFTCLFSGGTNREEQARKALESALGGKKNEFEQWNKEIKKREEAGGGGDSGGGGWFGWGGRFGWSDGENFWPEAQQTSLAVVGIIVMYLIVAKRDMMLAAIFNPLLYALRGTRNGLTSISSRILGKTHADDPEGLADTSKKEVHVHYSAKERVLRKWGSN